MIEKIEERIYNLKNVDNTFITEFRDQSLLT